MLCLLLGYFNCENGYLLLSFELWHYHIFFDRFLGLEILPGMHLRRLLQGLEQELFEVGIPLLTLHLQALFVEFLLSKEFLIEVHHQLEMQIWVLHDLDTSVVIFPKDFLIEEFHRLACLNLRNLLGMITRRYLLLYFFLRFVLFWLGWHFFLPNSKPLHT